METYSIHIILLFKRGSPFDMYLDYNAFNKYIYTRDNSKDLE